MVALLWAAGDAEAAIVLENLWNDLAETHEFGAAVRLPHERLPGRRQRGVLRSGLRHAHHGDPSESYSLLEGAEAKRREVSRLQQENAALRGEARRARAEQAITARRRHLDELCSVTMETIAEGIIEIDDESRWSA
jgi:hypothetical protein